MAIYIDDRELVAAHRAGDSDAFNELVREHRRSLLAHAKNKLHCDASAEDALQETLVRAYKALPRFEGEYRLGPWLQRIMHNVCIDEAHRRRRDGEKVDQYVSQRVDLAEAPSVEDELGLNFDDSALKAALDELSEPYREALHLKFVDEYDYSDLASIAGVSEQNARARVSRARHAMRSALRGVAAFPILLFGLLKRGEKAAAAATSSSGAFAVSGASSAAVITATEATVAAVHVAPTAVPLVTKAAVSIGLAAAVLTPTTDSAVHKAVEEIRSGAAGIVLEDPGSGFDVDSLVEISTEEVAALPNPRTEVGQVFEEATVQAPLPDRVAVLAIPQIGYTEAGPNRYRLDGRVEISTVSNERFFVLEDGSSLMISGQPDTDGRYRVDALLILDSGASQFSELRLAGFIENRENESRVAGLYRSVMPMSGVSPEGSFSGVMNVAPESSDGVFRLTLGS